MSQPDPLANVLEAPDGTTLAADTDDARASLVSALSTQPSLAERTVMLSGGAMAGIALTALNPVLPAIDAALAHSANQSLLVKQLLGAVALTMVIGAPLAGWLVDRFSLRRLLLVAAGAYTLAGTAGLYLSNLPVLLATRMVLGVAAGALQVISLTMINTRLNGANRAKYMGIHISIAMLTALVVNPVSGALGNIGWRWPFALYALGLILVPIALMQPDGQPPRPSSSTREIDARGEGLWRVFPYHYLPLAVMIGTLVFVPTVQAPFLMRDIGLRTPLVISLVLVADSIAGVGMALTYGAARRRISVHGAFAISFACVAVGALVSGEARTPATFVAGFMVHGVGVGWLIANMMNALSEKVRAEQQGRAAGLVKAAHFSSAPIGIALVEPIVRAHGPGAALLLVSGLAAALFVLMITRAWLLSRRFTKVGPAHAR